MTKLRLANIRKVFHENTVAVDNVSLSVHDGEFIVLVGPSGCGKSTVLRMIAGLTPVSGGEIVMDGRLINHVAPKDRDIAMVFQNYALYPHMTVYDNMAFGLKMRKIPKSEIKRRVDDAAGILGLGGLLARKSKALSGGQQQRVAVGRAIVRQPKLFLFDEPLSNLDAKLRVSMRAELIKLHKRLNATILYVTHDQVEAMSMGDRLVVFKDGKVQQIGAPLEIYHEPANLFVAGFIGSPAMNFISCAITRQRDDLFLVGPGLKLPLPAQAKARLESRRDTQAEIILGIRPEDIVEPRYLPDAPQEWQVSMPVEFIEPIGSEILATCRIGPTEAVVRLSAAIQPREGTPMEFIFNMERVKLFDPDTGDRVL